MIFGPFGNGCCSPRYVIHPIYGKWKMGTDKKGNRIPVKDNGSKGPSNVVHPFPKED